jgi:lipoprotein-releasing system permease protein
LKLLPLKIAYRYLVAKKSTNAINIITGISVLGISIGTAALILVLSVFNGFEDLILSLFSKFNPDIKVTVAEGKTFEADTSLLARIDSLDEVAYVSRSLEEVAFFEYDRSQDFGILKGVDSLYDEITGIDSTIFEGIYRLKDGNRWLAVLGGGMRNKLAVNIDDPFEPIAVYMARQQSGMMDQPFRKRFVYPVGTFRIQQDFDNQYVLVSLRFAQEILAAGDDEVSALEIRVNEGADVRAAIEKIKAIMGPGFEVKDRYQQDESFLKLMNIEKWMSFAILSLTLVLVAFNMIGALWMIVIEKKRDIAILKSMGSTDSQVKNIFLSEGFLLCILGLGAGLALALLLYYLQINYGLVPIPEGFVVDAYPISMRPWDVVAVAFVVFLIGMAASLPAALRAQRISALIREE